MKADDQTILSLDSRVITHNPRISVSHDEKLHTWQLRIRQLKDSDAGCYMCQINTNSMKKRLGCIDVQVPPNIDDSLTSGDITVQEGENVTLSCKAAGNPPPRIIWRREDGAKLMLRRNSYKVYKVDNIHGMQLILERAQRQQMGAYLCIASNDVPPAVSKRIMLGVEFPPSVRVGTDILGVLEDTEVEMACNIEAYPLPVTLWIKNQQEILVQSSKFSIVEITDGYRVRNTLTIHKVSPSDAGDYTCTSRNSLGKANATFKLYEVITTTTTTTESTTTELITTTETERTTTNPTYQTTTSKSTTIVLEALVEHPLFRYLPSEEQTTKAPSVFSVRSSSVASGTVSPSTFLLQVLLLSSFSPLFST
ncbi:lachesin isoform X2 [Agrilus planipennis]|nr:lachesin isoform X2 [Agrilus planipennis]